MIERWTGKDIKVGAKCFGEFVGTAVLVLLGDGVLANVLLRKSKAEGCGLADDFHWLGVCYCFRRIRSDRMRQPGPSLEPGGDFRCCDRNRRFLKITSLPGGADAGRYGGRVSGVAELPAPLEPNGRSLREANLLLNNARDSKFWSELAERNYRHVYARLGSSRDLFKRGSD